MMTRIRAEREKRGWTRLTMAQRLRAAADNPRDVPSLDILKQSIYRWERGAGMSERYQLMYCQALNLTSQQLFGGPDGPVSGPPALPLNVAEGSGYVITVLPPGPCEFSIELSGTITSTQPGPEEAGQPLALVKDHSDAVATAKPRPGDRH